MNPGPVDEFGNATRFVVGVCARRYKGDERSQVRSRLMERARAEVIAWGSREGAWGNGRICASLG